jgi:small multidrug resistance family-3 protein
MERLIAISTLFVLAGLCEIGGGYLVWGWMRESKPLFWALLGAAILAAYGIVAALQPISEFGRSTPPTAASSSPVRSPGES